MPWPVLGTAAAAAVGDFAAAGAPAAAVGVHEGAADPHPQYLTPAEGNAAYATAAQGALAGTAVQPAALATALASKVDTTDSRLSDAREWSAETATQAEAEAGTGTSRRAFTPQRVFQAIAAWWQTVSTVTGRSVVGAVDQAAARAAIGAGTSSVALSTNPAQGLGATAAAGSSGQAADAGHVHQLPSEATTSTAGLLSSSDKTKINAAVISNISGITGADAITNIVSLTQSEYDAIIAPNASTLYVIVN